MWHKLSRLLVFIKKLHLTQTIWLIKKEITDILKVFFPSLSIFVIVVVFARCYYSLMIFLRIFHNKSNVSFPKMNWKASSKLNNRRHVRFVFFLLEIDKISQIVFIKLVFIIYMCKKKEHGNKRLKWKFIRMVQCSLVHHTLFSPIAIAEECIYDNTIRVQPQDLSIGFKRCLALW